MWVSMPGAGAVVQGRQTLGTTDENEGGGGFAPGGITHHLGVVGRGAVDERSLFVNHKRGRQLP